MLHERTITLTCVFAAVLWGLAALFVLGGTIVAVAADEVAVAMSLMAHGIICAAGAGTVTVRNGLAKQNKLLCDAFRLGQESQAGVRRVGG